MQAYIESHYISGNRLEKVSSCLIRFREYVSRFPEVIKLTVCPVGSFTTGFASAESSPLDLVVCMDGGQLTNSLNGDQLALALSKGLNDWSELRNMIAVGNQTSTLILEIKETLNLIRIHACKPNTFPINYLYHSRLLTSYAFSGPYVVPLVSLVKQWAQTSGFSQSLATAQCPFSGFQWTLLVLYFLINSKTTPNLHQLTNALPDVPREIYGPHVETDSFVLLQDPVAVKRLSESFKARKTDFDRLIFEFFEWLGLTDLLTVMIDLKNAGSGASLPSIKRGWIVISDPTCPGTVNTVHTESGQKSQVEFAMKLRRTAKMVYDRMREGGENGIEKALSAKTRFSAGTIKVDKAVP